MADTTGVTMQDLQRTGTLAGDSLHDLHSAPTLEDYQFPTHRLKKVMADSSKTPIVLVSCGSFSPITFLHLRMFEMAADFAKYNTDFEVIGGYMSPVGDAYKKIGLARAHHRIEMCMRSTEAISSWIMVDTFEPLHKEYLPTAVVLDHMDHELNEVRGGIETEEGEKKKVRVLLLAGADLIQTMSTPGVWAPQDLDHILGRYGALIIERAGTETDEALQSLRKWEKNIYVIPQLVQNDVSSTKIRLFLKRDMSIRYLVPEPAIKYIEEHRLYEDDGTSSIQEKEKPEEKGKQPSGSS